MVRPGTLCSALKMLRPKMLHPEIRFHYTCEIGCCKLGIFSTVPLKHKNLRLLFPVQQPEEKREEKENHESNHAS